MRGFLIKLLSSVRFWFYLINNEKTFNLSLLVKHNFCFYVVVFFILLLICTVSASYTTWGSHNDLLQNISTRKYDVLGNHLVLVVLLADGDICHSACIQGIINLVFFHRYRSTFNFCWSSYMNSIWKGKYKLGSHSPSRL